jgi:cytochrome P450
MAMSDQKEKPLSEFNIFDPEMIECPFPYLKRLRDEAPVYRDEASGIFQVTNYELICQVARDAKTFSNNFGAQLAGQGNPDAELVGDDAAAAIAARPINTLLTADPPVHTRYRKLVNKAFSPKRVAELEPLIEGIVNSKIDAFINDGKAELLSQLSQPVTLSVIADQLGVPQSDIPTFRKWSDAAVMQLSQVASKEQQEDSQKKVRELFEYFEKKFAEKKANPSDDIITDLVNATLKDEGDPRGLEVGEFLSIVQQLLVAGNETTANAIVEGMYMLIDNPEQMEAVQNNLDLIPSLVEETLRLTTPTNNMWRVATKDTEVGGVQIPEGSIVLIRYGSGNRDESVFADPDKFDVQRENVNSQIAFGQGVHTCVGNALARKEMQVTFRAIFTRMKNFQFAEGLNDFRHNPNFLLRGLQKLHVTFDKA